MVAYNNERRRIVDETLGLLASEIDGSLLSPSNYALSNGGKRLRPLLCILVCELLGGKLNDTTSAFAALELIHNATLIHDDILDEDDYRRGKKSTPSKYGIKTAVITGDALLSLGLRHAASTGNPKIVEWLSETSLKMVTGIKKQADINGRIATPEEFLEVNYLKSGSLFEAAGALGALCAGKENEVEDMARLGRLYGDAYQINDDIADTESNGGENPRSDIENGDMTLPVIFGLQSNELTKEEKESLRANQPHFKEMLTRSGAIQRCVKMKDSFLDEANEILEKYGESDAKTNLIQMIREIRG